MKWLQKHILHCFIAGIVAVLPVFGMLIFVSYLEVQFASTGIDELRFYFPGLAIIITIVAIYLCGLIVTTFIGKWLWNFIDKFIEHIPGFAQIYGTIKEILGYSTDKNCIFKQVVLIPSNNGFGEELGLVTNSLVDDNQDKLVIFVPSAPTPTSGRLVVIDRDKVTPLEMSASDSFKAIIAMGKTENLLNELKKPR